MAEGAEGAVLRYQPTADGRCIVITLDRPAVLNAINHRLQTELRAAIGRVSADDRARVAIITGAGGRAFSTGADLKEMSAQATTGGYRAGGAFPVPHQGDSAGDDVRACSKPVIAAVDGYCVAAGFELALSCDIRVATRGSTFGLPEPRRSLIAGPGLHHLSRMIPLGEALRLQLTGGRMTAERAYQIGLVQELAEDRDDLMARAHAIAGEIVECAPMAVAAIKHIVTVGRDLPLERSWALAEPLQERLAASEDAREGPLAFAQRRPPEWKGR
jgi:enoyl-CoA hydratase/carnithine racemase